MQALHRLFLAPGALAFDIGAHVGDRTASFRRLGARVVAVEPQPAALRALRLMFGRDPGVALVEAAAGARAGTLPLHLNTRNPTVSTLSPEFIAAAAGAPGWEGQVWDRVVAVPVTTLDALIAAHGMPVFVKIDVEGLEDQVLAGLTRPIAALSFEFTTIRRAVALAALARVAALADYRFNLSLGEAQRLELPRWVPAAEMAATLREAPAAWTSGDVFARRA